MPKTKRHKRKPKTAPDTGAIFKEFWLKRLERSAEKWSNNRA